MIHPNIKFRISVKKDIETLKAFIKDAKYDDGRNLDWAVFNKYPKLKVLFDKNNYYEIKDEKKILDFINKEYHIKQKIMNKALSQHKKRWKKIAPHYFSLVTNLFGGRKWPRGKYIAFGTIWGMYPRFLNDKTFQIPFKHRTPRYIPVIIAHELLHFMFYEYFYTLYPKYHNPKHNFFVWHVSEIFNTIIQNSPTWLKYFKMKSLGYPEHEKIVMRLARIFYKCENLNFKILINEIVKNVQKAGFK